MILRTHWIFPLGISFFTFQSVSYIVDSYTKKIPSEKNFLNVALFISFFPIISSGPIQRAGNLNPQFINIRKKKKSFRRLSRADVKKYASKLKLHCLKERSAMITKRRNNI